MAEQRTTPGQRAELRERYAAAPGPTGCVHCKSDRPGVPAGHDDAGFCCWRCPDCGEVTDMTDPADPDVLAAVDDADALAGALAEVERLRAALAMVLDEMQGCEGRQGMWEDGIDTDYRRAIEQGRAALALRSGAPGDGAA